MAFHINKNGEPGLCQAEKGGCPFGTPDEHYGSRVQAREAYESTMPSFPTTDESVDEKSYSWEKGEVEVEVINDRVAPNKILLSPGRYFVGDPCYTAGYDDPAWQKWVNVTLDGATDEIAAGSYNGYPVIGASTAHGDGSFTDNEGNNYSVDAGMIGVVPAELISKLGVPERDYANAGAFVDLDHPSVLERDDNGTISIGDRVIVTDGSAYDEDFGDDDHVLED